MKNCLLTLKKSLLFALALLSGQQAFADGTKQVSPDSTTVTALTLIPNRESGSYLNAPVANRIRFQISNADEYVYMGFRWKEYVGSGTPGDVTMYYKIFNTNGSVVKSGALPNSAGPGFIEYFSQAVAGPNGVSGVTGGYNPLSFAASTLGGDGIGEYSMEFYRSSDGGATMRPGDVWSAAPYFDITIAKRVNTTYTALPGRVFCRKWGFVAVNTSFVVTAYANSSPSLYSYSDDQTIIKVGFNSVFRPIAFDMAVNYFGVQKTGAAGDYAVDRQSINSVGSPAIPDGYRLFLSTPDPAVFPVKPITAVPTLANPAITGCNGNLQINYNLPAPGDVRILIDLDGVTGYNPGTTDTILEAFNQPTGRNSVAWNGRDAKGNLVANLALIKLSVTYERGRFNVPIYDAEINKNGFSVQTILPLPAVTSILYWDDSSRLQNVSGSSDINQDNNTGRGIDNAFVGQLSPGHAWNGNGNAGLIIPAPSVNGNETNGVQYDDFGNVRVINTWGWALNSSSAVSQIKFGCFTVGGNVFHDSKGLTDGKVDKTSTIAIPSGLYAYVISKDVYTDNDNNTITLETVQGRALVDVATGTYSVAGITSGSYRVVLSTANIAVGSTSVPDPALPTAANGNWVNTGENLGAPTVTGNDGTVDGLLSITVNGGNISNANFGIQQLPTSTNVTATPQGNPGGTNRVTVPTLPGSDPEDGSYTGNNKIIITSLPASAKGTLYYNNVAVTTGQVIPQYDPSKLTLDPANGNVTVTFTYNHVDSAGFSSPTPGLATIEFKVIAVSGSIWDDGNGNVVKDAGELAVSGNQTSTTGVVSGDAPLYVYIVNGAGNVIQKAQVNGSGNYSFANAPYNMDNLSLVLSSTSVNVDASAPANTLGANWIYTGQSVNSANVAVQGTDLGKINLKTGTTAITNQNFGIERLPISNDVTANSVPNPGGNNRVQVPALTGTDGEDGSYADNAKIIIKTLPTNGTLYYGGTPVTAGQIIPAYVATQLTIDPNNGNVTTVFTYAHIDAAGKEDATPATVTMQFEVITVSGNVWDDANGNGTRNTGERLVSGNNTTTATTVAAGTPIYATLIDAGNKVLQSVAVQADGTYTLTNVPANTSGLKILLTKNTATENAAAPAIALPVAGWVYTGAMTAGNSASQNGAPDGTINLTTMASPIANQNFGIEKIPVSDAKTAASQGNPGGSNKVTVPTLTGTDLEDGNYTGVSLTDAIVIKTLPTNGTLYYNDVAVTAGQQISNYDPAKLKLDPADGNVTATFTYSHKDAASKESTPVSVTMTFGVIAVSGNVWQDKNGNKINDNGEKFISGTNVASGATSVASGAILYVNLLNASDVVIQSVQVSATGTYSLDKVPAATNNLRIQLSTTPGTVDQPKPATTLPPYYVVTGQSIGAGNTATQTGILNTINLNTGTAAITAQNFGMKEGGFCFVGRVYLEGALMNNGNAKASDGRPLMRDNLRNSPFTGLNYIPAVDPYEVGTEFTNFTNAFTKKVPQTTHPEFKQVTSAAVFNVTGQNAIVDWVFVELRDKTNSSSVLATRAGLVQRDGDIVDVDGTSCLFFAEIPADAYFVSVRHRSHLGTMTKSAQTIEQLTTMVDFTVPTTPLYDKGLVAATGLNYTGLAMNKFVVANYRALWAGDFDNNRKVKFAAPSDDNNVLLGDVLGYPTNTSAASGFDFAYGYMQGDFDLNSKAKYAAPSDDQNYLLGQILGYDLNTSSVTGFDFMIEQLP